MNPRVHQATLADFVLTWDVPHHADPEDIECVCTSVAVVGSDHDRVPPALRLQLQR